MYILISLSLSALSLSPSLSLSLFIYLYIYIYIYIYIYSVCTNMCLPISPHSLLQTHIHPQERKNCQIRFRQRVKCPPEVEDVNRPASSDKDKISSPPPPPPLPPSHHLRLTNEPPTPSFSLLLPKNQRYGKHSTSRISLIKKSNRHHHRQQPQQRKNAISNSKL